MEIHDALRELVTAHGSEMLRDSAGFRGVLDDVLEEDQATTGEINLLVDAVRFDVLPGLDGLLSGGATPDRAVAESGARLARERGGDDHVSASWAAAVLGYAVGKVPEAVVLAYRSQRAAGTNQLPPTTAPPVQSPPATWAPVQSPPTPPVQSPPATWHPTPPAGSPVPTSGPAPAPAYGGPGTPYGIASTQAPGGFPPPKKRSAGVWIAAAVALVVVVAGAIAAVLLAGGGDDDPKADDDPKSSPSASGPSVDVEPEALDERYDALAAGISSGAVECEAGSPTSGQAEVVDCELEAGTLQLVTWSDEAAFASAREARLDYRPGTITQADESVSLYAFDPEPASSSDSALFYWDNAAALQSALIRGAGETAFAEVRTLFEATSPRVRLPTAPGHPKLREFIEINMDVADCTRGHTYFPKETEEDTCEADVDGVVVSVGRFTTRAGLRGQREFYKGQFDASDTQGGGGTWRFGEGKAEGAYYGYLDEAGTTATLYWDWNSPQCFCYGIAWNFDGDLALLEEWWPSDEE